MEKKKKKKIKYYLYDLHTHTKESPDAISSIKDYIKIAKKRGLAGFAVTDHDKIYKGKTKINGITIIPGSEITLKDSSHLLAYYIKKPLPKKSLTLIEAVENIKRQGGYSSLAHPNYIIGGYFKKEGFFKLFNKKKEEIIKALEIVDGVESGNAFQHPYQRNLIKKIVEELNIKKIIHTAGSDSHSPDSLGLGVVRTKEPLIKKNFLRAIKEGKIVIKTKFNFTKRVLYFIERLFVIILQITFLYNNEIARKFFYKIFFRTYLKIKFFLLKKNNFFKKLKRK